MRQTVIECPYDTYGVHLYCLSTRADSLRCHNGGFTLKPRRAESSNARDSIGSPFLKRIYKSRFNHSARPHRKRFYLPRTTVTVTFTLTISRIQRVGVSMLLGTDG